MTDPTQRIAELTAQRERMTSDLEWIDREWRVVIGEAARNGGAVGEIAEAAKISRQRVYQIRDGKR